MNSDEEEVVGGREEEGIEEWEGEDEKREEREKGEEEGGKLRWMLEMLLGQGGA